jgi:hypothetical protein
VIARGQPPETFLGQVVLWLSTPIVGWDGLSRGAAFLFLLLLLSLVGATFGRGRA